jgi:hypothetical protein
MTSVSVCEWNIENVVMRGSSGCSMTGVKGMIYQISVLSVMWFFSDLSDASLNVLNLQLYCILAQN